MIKLKENKPTPCTILSFESFIAYVTNFPIWMCMKKNKFICEKIQFLARILGQTSNTCFFPDEVHISTCQPVPKDRCVSKSKVLMVYIQVTCFAISFIKDVFGERFRTLLIFGTWLFWIWSRLPGIRLVTMLLTLWKENPTIQSSNGMHQWPRNMEVQIMFWFNFKLVQLGKLFFKCLQWGRYSN